jgi:hypothetical protein
MSMSNRTGGGTWLVRKAQPKFEITHRYVKDPKAVEEGIELWATFLAGHLRRKLAERATGKSDKPA